MAISIRVAVFCLGTSRIRLRCFSNANNVAFLRNAQKIFCSDLRLVSEIQKEPPCTTSIHPISNSQLIWRAVKLPIYTVALIPLSVGSAVAFLESGAFDGQQYWLQLLSSVFVITWLNLSNDAYDAETGVDKDKKESLVNITGSQRGVLLVSFACLAAGCAGLFRAAVVASDLRVASFLTAAISCGYVYQVFLADIFLLDISFQEQCPPWRLSYKGLGEPLCFLAFGPFATTAFYLSQSHTSVSGTLPLTTTLLGASAVVGITTTLILFCSHFHQIEGDRAVGKFSPLVRLGTEKAAKVVQLFVSGLYAGVCALAASGTFPLPCAALCLLTFPLGKLVVEFVLSNHQDKEKIFLAKYYCVRLHTAFNGALVLGLLLQAWKPWKL